MPKFVCEDTIEEVTGGCMDMQERLPNVNAQVYTLHSQQCTCTHTSFSCAISMTFGSHSYNIARGGQHEWCMV